MQEVTSEPKCPKNGFVLSTLTAVHEEPLCAFYLELRRIFISIKLHKGGPVSRKIFHVG